MRNNLFRNLIRIYITAKEYSLTILGRSYFHEPPIEGRSWNDGKTFYYDFTSKLDWNKERIAGLPALRELNSDSLYIFPINALQYGLGAIDEGQTSAISHVEDWLESELRKNSSHIKIIFDGIRKEDVISDNSAMAIGHAISFIIRSNSEKLKPYLDDLLNQIGKNVDQGGCAIHVNHGVALLEVCYKTPVIVLNGWIFALFGLIDYCKKFEDTKIEGLVTSSLNALEFMTKDFVMTDGWTYYDNNFRVASPNYHKTHVVLFSVLAKMYPERKIFRTIYDQLKDADNFINRFRYSMIKIVQKFKEIMSL